MAALGARAAAVRAAEEALMGFCLAVHGFWISQYTCLLVGFSLTCITLGLECIRTAALKEHLEASLMVLKAGRLLRFMRSAFFILSVYLAYRLLLVSVPCPSIIISTAGSEVMNSSRVVSRQNGMWAEDYYVDSRGYTCLNMALSSLRRSTSPAQLRCLIALLWAYLHSLSTDVAGSRVESGEHDMETELHAVYKNGNDSTKTNHIAILYPRNTR